MMRRRIQNKSSSFDGSNYMTIEPLEECTIGFIREVKYTKDGKLWRNLKALQNLTLSKGELCYFKSTIEKYEPYGDITTTGKFNLKGNCMSLIFGDNAKGKYDLSEYPGVFRRLFTLSDVVEVEKTFLPATILSDDCYCEMFAGCKSLTSAPELPATILSYQCYFGLFKNCSRLNYIKALFTTQPATGYTGEWVKGVASTGTFVKNPNATWDVVGDTGIPEGWIVKFDGEEDGGNLISFTIDGTQYQAEEGMTWGEWVDSEYNVNGDFSIIFDNSIIYRGNIYFVGTEEDYVFAPDIIQENYNYLLVA